MNRSRAACLAAVLFALPACNQSPPEPPGKRVGGGGRPAVERLRLATWNIHQGHSPDPTGRMLQWPEMLAALELMVPDVVVMQETLSGLDTNDALIDVQHARDLAVRMGGYPAFAAQMRSGTVFPHINAYEAGLFGNSTVSVLPLEGVASFPLSDNRTALVTRIAGIDIANIHLTAADHDAASREMLELIYSLPLSGPTIIAGDFNARQFDMPVELARDAGFTSCASLGVDHVMVSSHFECGFAEYVSDELSDHPRIVVNLLRAGD